ncbi:hypothetical protein FRC00_008740 [Tulasnella sp. 408]|nr:hypothetical protein FRC00_008740 [Tulasnella sp. 408]
MQAEFAEIMEYWGRFRDRLALHEIGGGNVQLVLSNFGWDETTRYGHQIQFKNEPAPVLQAAPQISPLCAKLPPHPNAALSLHLAPAALLPTRVDLFWGPTPAPSPATPLRSQSLIASNYLSQTPSTRFPESNAAFLPAYDPLPDAVEARPIVAALAAFQALKANQLRIQREFTGSQAIDYGWYLKDLGKRKAAFSQTAGILHALCSYLELTTDATIVLYAARAERTPGDITAGRDEAIYANFRGRKDPNSLQLYDGTIRAARLFADSLAAGWTERQNGYNRVARNSHRRRGGRLVFEALCNFDWSLHGLDAPQCVELSAPSPPPDFIGHQLSSLDASTSPTPNHLTFSTNKAFDWDEPSPAQGSSTRNSGASKGRHATEEDLQYMDECGLSELRKALIRLAVWEEDHESWYHAFRSIVGDNTQVVYGLLGIFSQKAM